jgi:acetyl esterase/lipase
LKTIGEASVKSWLALLLAVALTIAANDIARAEYEVVTRANVAYVEHDGIKLTGDLYLPKGLAKAPVIVAVHGGGWQNGNRSSFNNLGPYLAKNGYALFTISYRLGKAGLYPREVYDVKAAIQFVRANAADLGVDAERIGLMGQSAGAHLVALLGLAHDQFSAEYRDDANAAVPAGVKSVVAFYGIYDMVAQWQHDQIQRPRDQIAEKFLGAPPSQNRRVYFESSPMSYATVASNRPHFLLVHGTADDIVDPESQSFAFMTALKQAAIRVNRIVVPGAAHGFGSEPIDSEDASYMSGVAPKVLRFLKGAL